MVWWSMLRMTMSSTFTAIPLLCSWCSLVALHAQDGAGRGVRRRPVLDHRRAVDDHPVDRTRALGHARPTPGNVVEWLELRWPARREIEDRDVGSSAHLELAAVLEPEEVGHP